tara:strand:+ start:2497 stop:3006 length:510 start_codon:yes stop_codon:yes gene_type:complete
MISFPVVAAEDDAEKVGLNIAVVDVQQLMGVSKAGKSIQSQGKDIVEKYQKDMSGIQKDLKSAEKKVVDAQNAKDKEEFQKQFQAFQKELKESQEESQQLRMKNDQAVADALNILRDEIVEIVDEMTVKNNYDLVITRADVITVSKNIDITAEVMKELDSRLKTVKVNR